MFKHSPVQNMHKTKRKEMLIITSLFFSGCKLALKALEMLANRKIREKILEKKNE